MSEDVDEDQGCSLKRVLGFGCRVVRLMSHVVKDECRIYETNLTSTEFGFEIFGQGSQKFNLTWRVVNSDVASLHHVTMGDCGWGVCG